MKKLLLFLAIALFVQIGATVNCQPCTTSLVGVSGDKDIYAVTKNGSRIGKIIHHPSSGTFMVNVRRTGAVKGKFSTLEEAAQAASNAKP